MKQKLIVALVASALGGIAATPAHAGVIQATYKIFAAEAFGGATTLTAPLVSYNLSRPISGSAANPNNFSIALTLTSGVWNSTATNYRAVLRDPSSANNLPNTGAATVSADGKTVTFNFSADQDGVTYPANSTITFGDYSAPTPVSLAAAGASATPSLFVDGTESTLKAPLDSACAPTQAQISVSVKMTNASGVEVDTNDPGAIVSTPVLASNVALNISGTTSATLGALQNNNEISKIDVLSSGLGKVFTDTSSVPPTQTADVTNGNTLTLNVGKVTIKEARHLFDVDGAKFYTPETGAITGANNPGDGRVAGETLTLNVTGKFAAGSSLGLFRDASCTTPFVGAGGVAVYNAAMDTATFTTTINDADWLAANAPTRDAYVCYKVVGTSIIPSAQFNLTATGGLSKVAASKELTNPVCAAPLYNLSTNGVQVDVRNYIHAANTAAYNGWQSTLRVINTDEVQTVDVMAQYIDENGNLLASGKIATLAPRAAKYVGNDVVQAALGALPASANNSRLRITAAGSSLRVQNYIYDPVRGTYIEASSSQGDEGPRDVQPIETHTSK